MTAEPAPAPTTTYDDVVEHFMPSPGCARQVVDRWSRDPHKQAVVPFVEAAVTTSLYRATPESISAVCAVTDHALGDVERSAAESVRSIVDWHPSFAFEHALHHADETLGSHSTWQDFRAFCATDPRATQMLVEPARQAVAGAGVAPAVARAAMRWRVGNAYLAHVKQAYVVAVLRAGGFDARYHVLADVLLRVDFWIDRTCFALYVVNPKFRATGHTRRKTLASAILDERFNFAEVALPVRREFGTVRLPDPEETLTIVRAALDAGAG